MTTVVDRALPLYRGRYQRALTGEGSPRQAIGTKCLECCAWDVAEARECHIQACPLWAYNPWRLRQVKRAAANPEPSA